MRSNNLANQDKLIKEVSTSERAVPVRLGGSDASPASGPIFSKNLNQTLIILLKTGRSKRRRRLAGMTDLFTRGGGRERCEKGVRGQESLCGPFLSTSRRRRLTQQVRAALTQFNKRYGRERRLIKHRLLLPSDVEVVREHELFCCLL